MSTNYYIRCHYCGNEIKHIGKHSNNEFLSNITLKEFFDMEVDTVLYYDFVNEYGERITVKEFLKRIPDNWVLVKGEFS